MTVADVLLTAASAGFSTTNLSAEPRSIYYELNHKWILDSEESDSESNESK